MGAINDFLNYIRPNRQQYSPSPDAVDSTLYKPVRGGPQGEIAVNPYWLSRHLAVDEGAYWTVQPPAAEGTGVAYALQTAFSDTVGLFVVYNQSAPLNLGGRNVFLDRLKLLLLGTAPATTTALHGAVRLDTLSRVPTANAAARAGANPSPGWSPTNQNPGSSYNPMTRLWEYAAGSLTVPASSNQVRRAARWMWPTGLGITGDEYEVQFGASDIASARSPLTAVRATDVARMTANASAVVIPPGWFAVIHLWWLTATTTAPTFDYELSGFEK